MKSYLLCICCIGLQFLTLYGQQSISGTVLSAADNRPVAGASVKLADGTAAMTDMGGRFTVRAAASSTVVVVSHVGYRSDTLRLSLPLAAPFRIRLQPAGETLQEVQVSTGYEVLPKERSTGSFSHVSGQGLAQQVSTDVLSRLEAIAGAYMVERRGGLPARPLVRGLGTINGPTEPLIVLDNFPYEGDLDNINPNEIEDITILKDAAAASIWGARAGNGVIVIRTKGGHFNEPVRIDVQANTTVGSKPDLGYLPLMGTSDFIDVEKMLYEQGFYTSKLNSTTKPALSPVVELLVKRDGATPEEAAVIDREMDALRGLDVRNNFDRYVYRPSVNQQYALGFSGGSGRMAWQANAGYDRNRSELDAGYERLNLRLQNRYKPTARFELTSGLRYTNSSSRSGRPGYGDISVYNGQLYPYAQLADDAGNALPLTKQYRQTFIDAVNGEGKLLDWSYYPLEDDKHMKAATALSDMLVNVQARYELTGWLAAEADYQYEQQETNGRNLRGLESFFTRDLINYYSNIDASAELFRPVPVGDILDRSHSLLQSQQVRGKLLLNKDWNGLHRLTGLAGVELRHAGTGRNSYRTYGYDDEILTFGAVDYTRQYPNYVSGSASFIPRSESMDELVTRFASVFANGAYVFKNRYTFSFSGRRDASNLFGLTTNDQWNLFWSAGTAWDVAKEPFYRVDWLPALRARLTYGSAGNVNPAMVAVTTIAYRGTDATTLTPSARFENYFNPELRWETATTLNAAVDFGLLNNRLGGSVEYYWRKGTDLFGRALIDYTAGVGRNITKNVGSMLGRGLDIELNSLNIDAGVKWQSTLMLSHYSDRVLRNIPTSASVSSIVNAVGGTTGLLAVEGKPVNAVYSFRWAGLDPATGDPRGYINGEPSNNYSVLMGTARSLDDLVYHGSAIPTWYGSLGNTISYKQFSLNFSLTYRFGYYFRRSSVEYYYLFNNWQYAHADFAQRWQHPGDEQHTYVPSMAYPANSSRDIFYTGSEMLVERGDHIRLQYVHFEYTLPGWRKKNAQGSAGGMQVYVNINNPGLLWKANKAGLDPDFAGVNNLVTPVSYSLGLRMSFH